MRNCLEEYQMMLAQTPTISDSICNSLILQISFDHITNGWSRLMTSAIANEGHDCDSTLRHMVQEATWTYTRDPDRVVRGWAQAITRLLSHDQCSDDRNGGANNPILLMEAPFNVRIRQTSVFFSTSATFMEAEGSGSNCSPSLQSRRAKPTVAPIFEETTATQDTPELTATWSAIEVWYWGSKLRTSCMPV